ncbi:hypothetical protein PUMCH_000801 [Australozyma saopauloensis]|uniref:Uncharacterized protein n=1 Tax=Australozyma saopauloensis TaxID=291208 RepID=A0AAX4H4Q9_9ASCO|nr:hypothetical protein PUMCH_000801 [[Candida] saopauloensis]
MKVPKPLEALFDTFPLQTFPVKARDYLDSLEKYPFLSTKDLASSNVRFLLAVHNVRETELRPGFSRFLATDPLGLADALILCRRHDLRLAGGAEKLQMVQSQHCMVPLSYLASPDNTLPILVETQRNTTKCVTTCAKISAAVAAKSFATGAIDSTVNHFLDTLQTLWVFTLLHEVFFSSNEVLELVFAASPTDYLGTVQLIENIQGWGHFREKYGNLYSDYADVAKAPLAAAKRLLSGPRPTVTDEAFKKAYAAEIAEFFKTLPLVAEHIRGKLDSEAKAVLEIKLAAFLVCCVNFLPSSSVLSSLLVKDHLKLVEESISVVLKY